MEFPYGKIVSEVPAGFSPPEMWAEYGAISAPVPICKKETVGKHPEGIRWSLWPLTFEAYWGDGEPDMIASSLGTLTRNRIIIWKRIRNFGVPKGWYQFSKKPERIDGFYEFNRDRSYIQDWSRIAKRHLKIWKEEHEKNYSIEKISFEEYLLAYKKSTVAKRVGSEAFGALRRKYELPLARAHMELWGVRNRQTDNIIAGVILHFPSSHNSSVHECPFVLTEGQEVHAMVALFDHWFRECVRRDVDTLYMTFFWYPGKPKEWKGFSLFKSHFGLTYVAYPPPLFKFVKGKIF